MADAHTDEPTRWISEADVVDTIDLLDAVAVVEEALRDQAIGQASTMEKTHLGWEGGHTLHALGGLWQTHDLVGTKTWAHTAGGATPLLTLWSASSGRLRAVLEAFALGQLRTAAISAVATRHLAPLGWSTMAMVGTGRQALPQVAAAVVVGSPRQVRVYSPNPQHRRTFCDQLRATDWVTEVIDCRTVEEALSGADVVTVATRARQPFVRAAHLEPTCHLNAVGAITPERRELADDVARTASMVVADSPAAAGALSTELATARQVVALSAVLDRADPRCEGRTVFKAMGIGLADIALGAAVLERLSGPSALCIPSRSRPTPRMVPARSS